MGRPREISAESRATLLHQGFRPVEIWVPNVHNPLYRAEADRQAGLAALADAEDDVMDWVENIAGDAWERP